MKPEPVTPQRGRVKEEQVTPAKTDAVNTRQGGQCPDVKQEISNQANEDDEFDLIPARGRRTRVLVSILVWCTVQWSGIISKLHVIYILIKKHLKHHFFACDIYCL